MNSIISELVWENDIDGLKKLLEKVARGHPDVDYISSVDEWDQRGKITQSLIAGNPPLHLALMLGRKEAVKLLLDAGASCSSINGMRRDALDEAASFGNRDILGEIISRRWREESEDFVAPSGAWEQFTRNVPEAYFEIEIKLKSKVPVIAKMCPSDKIRVWKTPKALRIDWTIARVSGIKLIRAAMSILARIERGNIVQLHIVNRDDKIYEQILPNISANILHDLVDSFMNYGVVRDEIPVETFELKRIPGSFSKAKTKYIKKLKVQADVYKLDSLSWLQHYQMPIMEHTLHERCDDKCRNLSIGAYQSAQRMIKDEKKHKVESLEALQFISNSELALEDDDEFAKAQKLLDSDSKLGDDDIGFLEKTFKAKLARITKHVRSSTRSSALVKLKKEVEQEDPVNYHLKSFPMPRPDLIIPPELYFADGEPISVGRELRRSTSTFTRNRPFYLFVTKEFPLKTLDLLPILEWLTKESVPAGRLRKFIEENCPDGFPVRLEIPLMSMLSCKITVTKCELKIDEKTDFNVPADCKPGAVFPLVEF